MDLKHYPRQWWVKGRLLVRIPESFVDLQVGEVGESGERLSGKKNFYRVLARHTPQVGCQLNVLKLCTETKQLMSPLFSSLPVRRRWQSSRRSDRRPLSLRLALWVTL